ncbi:MAG: transglutaminase domain-containing protein [Pseudothermotoga sp.]|nr:transglutaminase domain-containing protein [Pseudothermotoga sp.]HBT39777.1 hypothetical protein [Pseudothermotoga sp.]HCO97290.1 hypothetical protein [Pseudothermotoga sp.]
MLRIPSPSGDWECQIQHDLPSFVRRGGGDCDDFALAVCRLAQALGYKAYYVTGFSWSPRKNHAWAIVTSSHY